MDSWVGTYGIGFPATLFLGTVLGSTQFDVRGGIFIWYKAYVLRLETYHGLQRR